MGSAIAIDSQPEPLRHPSRALVTTIGLGGCALAAFSLVFALTDEAIGPELGEPLVIALLDDWITLSYVLGGLVVWYCRPGNRFGPLMIVAGAVNFLTTLSWSENDLVSTIGQAFDLVAPALFLHLFLAFPSGVLPSTFARVLVVFTYVVAVGLELVRAFLGELGPSNLLAVTSRPDVALTVRHVQLVTVGCACLCGVGLLARRRWRSGPALRRSSDLLVDVFALSLVLIALLLFSATVGWPWARQLRWATFVALGLVPSVFVIGLLGARLARSAVGDLLVELRSEPSPADLRPALARALRDPSLTLAFWIPEFETYADLDGRPMELPPERDGRATTLIDREDEHVAALLHDAALNDEPALLESVCAAAAIALENARLHAELRARLEELKGSRARIVEATDSERRRLERNLHDGAQQRLVAISLELGRLEARAESDPEMKEVVQRTKREAEASLNELREVARGIHPALVTDHGLTVALEALVARAPIPVSLQVELDRRLPHTVEVAAYYVVAECVTNAAKYASASSTRVGVRRDDGRVIVEISDDGIGGADTDGGSGLRGLADRVEALNGRLRVWSPIGGGTRVRAEIPCA